jgi:hypothetical protein
MSKKLQNIKAIQQMLGGNHKFQTRKSFFFSEDKPITTEPSIRKVGDRWVEEDASGWKTYCELRGANYVWKSSTPFEYWDEHEEYWKTINSFTNCQKETCTCRSPTKVDEKFRRIMGMCTDCVAEVETKMQIRGEFSDYARNKILENVKAYLRDIEIELESWKRDIRSKMAFANGDATIEEWQSNNPELLIEKMESEFHEMKHALLSTYDPEYKTDEEE